MICSGPWPLPARTPGTMSVPRKTPCRYSEAMRSVKMKTAAHPVADATTHGALSKLAGSRLSDSAGRPTMKVQHTLEELMDDEAVARIVADLIDAQVEAKLKPIVGMIIGLETAFVH